MKEKSSKEKRIFLEPSYWHFPETPSHPTLQKAKGSAVELIRNGWKNCN